MSQAKIGNETDGEAYRNFVVCAVAYIPKPHLMSSLRQYLLIPFGMVQCYRRGKLYKAVLSETSLLRAPSYLSKGALNGQNGDTNELCCYKKCHLWTLYRDFAHHNE